ncbi:hypothetical protein [Pseudomonas fluorescens]|uniref:Uncharacterized protein n=1 Tax=Pseudomonas fluorescens TaxID=294 RepID=A0A5E7DID2_PSEFL|nr:hypothetical protein [Pseudomonas fluorescens]VVO07994.1 hypothetical protein PS691_03170 [Pseudomonas fluorescens]
MRNLNLLLLVCCASVASNVQAQSIDNGPANRGFGNLALYDGQDQGFFDPEPLAYRSAPPRTYLSTSPQRFVPISDGHDFHNSRLPIATDEKPRVLIRSYHPDLGVSIDTEVTDPACLSSCRNPEAARNR